MTWLRWHGLRFALVQSCAPLLQGPGAWQADAVAGRSGAGENWEMTSRCGRGQKKFQGQSTAPHQAGVHCHGHGHGHMPAQVVRQAKGTRFSPGHDHREAVQCGQGRQSGRISFIINFHLTYKASAPGVPPFSRLHLPQSVSPFFFASFPPLWIFSLAFKSNQSKVVFSGPSCKHI
jgi:hypothetical protein